MLNRLPIIVLLFAWAESTSPNTHNIDYNYAVLKTSHWNRYCDQNIAVNIELT